MTIDECREGIDRIDRQMLALLNERALLAQIIGDEKKMTNQPIFVPEREKAVLNRLKEENTGPLSGKAVETIFKAVIGEVRALEMTKRDENREE